MKGGSHGRPVQTLSWTKCERNSDRRVRYRNARIAAAARHASASACAAAARAGSARQRTRHGFACSAGSAPDDPRRLPTLVHTGLACAEDHFAPCAVDAGHGLAQVDQIQPEHPGSWGVGTRGRLEGRRRSMPSGPAWSPPARGVRALSRQLTSRHRPSPAFEATASANSPARRVFRLNLVYLGETVSSINGARGKVVLRAGEAGVQKGRKPPRIVRR